MGGKNERARILLNDCACMALKIKRTRRPKPAIPPSLPPSPFQQSVSGQSHLLQVLTIAALLDKSIDALAAGAEGLVQGDLVGERCGLVVGLLALLEGRGGREGDQGVRGAYCRCNITQCVSHHPPPPVLPPSLPPLLPFYLGRQDNLGAVLAPLHHRQVNGLAVGHPAVLEAVFLRQIEWLIGELHASHAGGAATLHQKAVVVLREGGREGV